MKPYLPHTNKDIQEMLNFLGINEIDELFQVIPEEIRKKAILKLGPGCSEQEAKAKLTSLACSNKSSHTLISFLGGGVYRHYVPATVSYVLNRGEFFTAYTPYQPEISQGTLQAIYEYQSLICLLTGMEVANASMYDGATAFAEAVLMACRITRKNQIFYSLALNPIYLQVLKTYLKNTEIKAQPLPLDKNGTTSLETLNDGLNTCAAVAIQSPNYFGCVEDYTKFAKIINGRGPLLIGVCTEPISLGILKPPGECGVDIFVAEGQSLGLGLNFGGPNLGIFATRKEFVRQMPGRIVGKTIDAAGKPGYVLTLSTREQHIKREKATSNICTNEGLCALACAVYLSTLGKEGLRELAIINLQRARYVRDRILDIPGFSALFKAPFFNEFAIHCPAPAETINRFLLKYGIIGGLPLHQYIPKLAKLEDILFAVTEMNSVEEINLFLNTLEMACHA